MPSKSAKQHRFMEMVAHDPKAAKRVGVPSSVGREFVATDKGKKFKAGGEMKKPSKKTVFKGKESAAEERAEAKMGKYKKGGKTKCFAKGGEQNARMLDDGSYSMGKPPTLGKAASDNDQRLLGGSGYKPTSQKSSESTTKWQTTGTRSSSSLEDLKAPSKAKDETPPKTKEAKPAVKKSTPAHIKRTASRPTETAASRASRQAGYDDWKQSQAGLSDLVGSNPVDSGDELPVGADAYKKGGKTSCMKKGGNVRGHGAERTGRTRGRFI